MAKDNLFLGFGRGKIGDVVFSRVGGQQVARARNRSPKNPQTPLQLLQRVVMKTTSVAYSLLQDICNHSFQGQQEGTPNQSRFAKLNVEYFRNFLDMEFYQAEPEEILSSAQANFNTKGSSVCMFNPYVVSEGTLGSLDSRFIKGISALVLPLVDAAVTESTLTYQNVVDALAVQRGDQLTFLQLSTPDLRDEYTYRGVFNSFKYARVILEPSDGDMSSLFIQNGAVNKPSSSNQGSIRIGFTAANDGNPAYLSFLLDGINQAAGTQFTAAGCTVILSRLGGGIWQRSSQSLAIRSSEWGEEGALISDVYERTLSDAVYSFMTGVGSSLYLNQSGSMLTTAAPSSGLQLYFRQVKDGYHLLVDNAGAVVLNTAQATDSVLIYKNNGEINVAESVDEASGLTAEDITQAVASWGSTILSFTYGTGGEATVVTYGGVDWVFLSGAYSAYPYVANWG